MHYNGLSADSLNNKTAKMAVVVSPDKNAENCNKLVKDFLDILYGIDQSEGYLVLWTKQDKRSYFFSLNNFSEVSKKAVSLSQDMDVYYGVGLQKTKPVNGGRGRKDTVISIPGLWLDIDIKGPHHAASDLPPDEKSVEQILDLFTLKPSMIVKTGGGYHIYWLFEKPMILTNEGDREKAKQLSTIFQSVFQSLAADKGWKIDNTADLSRLLRLPGTYNHKTGNSAPVEIQIHEKGNRYDTSEIAEALNNYEAGATAQITDDSPPIEQGDRNTTLTSIGGKLRAQGLDYEEILQRLDEINQSRCVPPLSDDELDGIARSVSEYDADISQQGKKEKQSDRLIKLCDNMQLFHTADGECYAEIPVGDHIEIWSVKSNNLRDYLAKSYYDRYSTAPGTQGLQNALNVFKGKAKFDAPEKQVYVRLASFDNSVYLDLCNDNWEVVQITPNGWRITNQTPVAFIRNSGMKALPRPEHGGNINELRRVINAKNETEWVLLLSWLVGAFSPGPYPILIIHGEQGSAKSTTARILRELVDPSVSPLKTFPRDDRDLMIHAKNNWVIAFDNLSGLSRTMSDNLCRLSTGGGLSKRSLYSDSDEVIFDAKRPMILNGIDNIASRNDLSDRAIIANLPRIPEEKRKLERDLWNDVEEIKPKVLGAILDAVSCALKNSDKVKLAAKPRMADFAQWVVAAEPKLPWNSGSFLKIYNENRSEALSAVFDSDFFAMNLKNFIQDRKNWSGTASDMKKDLENYITDEEITKSKYWPKAPNSVSRKIKLISPSLRSVGIEVEFLTGGKIWKFKYK